MPRTLLFLLLLLSPSDSARPADPPLRETAGAWDLEFRHHHGGSGKRYLVETMAGGALLFDYDRDGDVDVLFVDGGRLPGYQGEPPRTRLFRNEGEGRFADVTEGSGVIIQAYGMGATAGDVDGDGDLDLYVTALGPNQLLRNNGDGSFTDSGVDAGVADPLFGASAAFADPDRDGDLDLYLTNYVDFTVAGHRPCFQQELEVYCFPRAYRPQPDRYFRNRGDGTFEEAASAVSLDAGEASAGLGVVFGDLDNDGWSDLYVGNDSYANFLYRNRGDGTFEDLSLLSGTAYGDGGRPEAGMGVDLGDVDGDGLLDIVVTNFELETNALYKNLGDGLFIDSRFAVNIAESSLLNLAFGVAFADLDHDADLDLVVANGHIHDNAHELHERGRYAQRNQLFDNRGGRFAEIAESGMDAVRVSRGLAHGDLDGDGDLDLVINNSNDLAEVYENVAGSDRGHWLQIDLLAATANTAGVDGRVEVETGQTRQFREVRTGSSYLSQSSMTLHFGLGAAATVDRLTVRWPDGARRVLRDVPADRRLRIDR